MTSALDASLFLSGATPGDVFEVSRTVSLGASKPEYFRVPGMLMDEALVVTHTGAGGFTATLQWEFDPNSPSGLGGSPIDTVFRFADAGTEPAAVFNVTSSGNVLSIPGLTGFSTFYAGNAMAVPVTLSGFALDGPPERRWPFSPAALPGRGITGAAPDFLSQTDHSDTVLAQGMVGIPYLHTTLILASGDRFRDLSPDGSL